MSKALMPINRLYNESFALLLEARNYFAYGEGRNPPLTAAQEQFLFNYHALRLTSRMTQVMAWMLAQRAVQAGEISPEEACGGTYSLGGERICIESDDAAEKRLPSSMRQLLSRSHSLYMRVWRLDQDARQIYN